MMMKQRTGEEAALMTSQIPTTIHLCCNFHHHCANTFGADLRGLGVDAEKKHHKHCVYLTMTDRTPRRMPRTSETRYQHNTVSARMSGSYGRGWASVGNASFRRSARRTRRTERRGEFSASACPVSSQRASLISPPYPSYVRRTIVKSAQGG